MSKQQEIEACRKEIEELKQKLNKAAGEPNDCPLADYAEKTTPPKPVLQMKQRRVLKGHFGKIYAMQWATDSKNLVSASQDGKLLIWNAFTTNKLHAIPLRSAWVMTCAYSPSGNFVACGGLDNLCSIYRVSAVDPNGGQTKTHAELAQHEGYLSCCRFIKDSEILTSSGDSTCILWDVENKSPKAVFTDHAADVMSVSVCEQKNVFVSGSTDSMAKVWDLRSSGKGCIKTFTGHESDINAVQFHPDGQAFGSGSDDSSCRLWDLRAYRQLNRYANEKILCGITSIAFSKGGKFLFAGYDDYNTYVWDVIYGNQFDQLSGHENRVSCVGVTDDGKALCTGSWDAILKIWA